MTWPVRYSLVVRWLTLHERYIFTWTITVRYITGNLLWIMVNNQSTWMFIWLASLINWCAKKGIHLDRAKRESCLLHNNMGSHEDAGCDLIIAWDVIDPFVLNSHASACKKKLLIKTRDNYGAYWSSSRLLLSSHVSWSTFIFFVHIHMVITM